MASVREQALEYAMCSISLEVMVDPVVCADGVSYERAYIEEWFATGHITSPSTNTPLANFNVIPNITLRGLVQHLSDRRDPPAQAEPEREVLDRKVAMLEARLRQMEMDRARNVKEKADLEGIVAALSASAEDEPTTPSAYPTAYELGGLLITASERGDLAAVRRLTDAGASTSRMRANTDKFGNGCHLTALGRAACNGHVRVVEHLVANGASPCLTDDFNASVLRHAAADGHVEVARFCASLGGGLADLSCVHDFGSTPLMDAVFHNAMTTVRFLCDAKADVNQRGGHGATALHRAASVGAWDVIRYLCEQRSADVLAEDDAGRTPRFVMYFSPWYSALDPNARARVVEYWRAREAMQAGRSKTRR